MDLSSIVFVFFVVVLCIQLLYFLLVYSRLAYFKETKGNFKQAVSVVVCGYNEADNWKRLIPLLIEQDYPSYEVVIVNDQSNDNTHFIFKEWDWHPKIKVVSIDEHVKKTIGKKFALTLGIKAASHDYLLLTDADCYPKDANWISTMVQHFSEKTEIVLGYGAHERQAGFLNKLLRFDTFQIAMQYLSYSLIGHTYMGVGRNLAYNKSLFFDNKGFASHLHLPSGDDDLFIREVSTKNNVSIALSPSAQTLSVPKETWLAWVKQKTRHLSTGGHYSLKHQFLLALWGLTQAAFWLLASLLIYFNFYVQEVILLLSLRLLLQAVIYSKLMRRLREDDLIWWFPFLEILQLFFQLIFLFSNVFKRKKGW